MTTLKNKTSETSTLGLVMATVISATSLNLLSDQSTEPKSSEKSIYSNILRDYEVKLIDHSKFGNEKVSIEEMTKKKILEEFANYYLNNQKQTPLEFEKVLNDNWESFLA